MTVEIGSPAPDFTLPDQEGNPVSLESVRGHKALIVFIPFPFTGICEGELCTIRDHLADLANLDAKTIVITCDTAPSNKRWSEENDFTFPVLSDYWPHGAVAREYDAFNETTGSANRKTIVLDPDATVRAIIETESLRIPREFDAYTEALATI